MTKSGCCWEEKALEETGKSSQHVGGHQRLWEPQKIIINGVVLSIIEGERAHGGTFINQKDLHRFHSRLNPESKLEQEGLQMIAEWLSSQLVNVFSQVSPEGGREFCQHQDIIQ